MENEENNKWKIIRKIILWMCNHFFLFLVTVMMCETRAFFWNDVRRARAR